MSILVTGEELSNEKIRDLLRKEKRGRDWKDTFRRIIEEIYIRLGY